MLHWLLCTPKIENVRLYSLYICSYAIYSDKCVYFLFWIISVIKQVSMLHIRLCEFCFALGLFTVINLLQMTYLNKGQSYQSYFISDKLSPINLMHIWYQFPNKCHENVLNGLVKLQWMVLLFYSIERRSRIDWMGKQVFFNVCFILCLNFVCVFFSAILLPVCANICIHMLLITILYGIQVIFLICKVEVISLYFFRD
jgi:hypothetical protein